MTGLEAFGTAILAKRRAMRGRSGRATRAGGGLILLAAGALLAGCFARHDWRDWRPDCAKDWCGFVATFPGRTISATREIPVGSMQLPLTIHVSTVDEVRFTVAAFELRPGADPVAAREVLQHKLLDDVGATQARRGTATLRTADRTALTAETFDAEGAHDGRGYAAHARFVEHKGRLVEILVVGPALPLASDSGRQVVETFLTSLRLD